MAGQILQERIWTALLACKVNVMDDIHNRAPGMVYGVSQKKCTES